jgi:hypothetical protein
MARRSVKFVREKREHNAAGYRDELNDSSLWVPTQLAVIGADGWW